MHRVDELTFPTWERYSVLAHFIGKLNIREKRIVFSALRDLTPHDSDVFFPEFGFTLGEFAVWYTIDDNRRRKKKPIGLRQ